MLKTEEFYRAELAWVLQSDPGSIFLYWKGRVALYALLKAMNVGKDDEVIIPAFTCVVVANAIKYLGAKPVYVDINPVTYNMEIRQLEKHVSPKTKVIMCQNTFGLSCNLEKIIEIAKIHDIFTIEDCTHGFGGTYAGKPNGTFCDAAFYSTQWNKPFSTGIGGIAVVHHETVKKNLTIVNASVNKASFFNNLSLAILYVVREHIMINQFYWTMLKAYRWLSRYNLVQGSSSGQELIGTVMPKNYFKGISEVQIRKGIQNLRSLPETMETRKRTAKMYTEYLKKEKKNHVALEWFENHSFLVYPLRVKNRDKILKKAESKKIPLGEWFRSPLHPVTGTLESWDLEKKKYPVACKISQQIVNLPTNPSSVESVLAFLDEIKESIL